jgi:phosphatidylglycerophosphate synthase
VFLPCIDLGWVSPWLVGALFVREFLVTAARTSYERRGLQLKSSYLARYKTWAQMCGIGIILFTNVLAPSTTDLILGILAVSPVIGWIGVKLKTGRSWKGAIYFAPSFLGCVALHHYFGPKAFATGLMYFVVGITWASGLGYLTGIGQLRGRGRIEIREIVRIVTAVTIPVFTVLVEQSGHGLPVATILLLSCELAHGGLDNLLAAEKAEARALEWGGRTLLITVLLAISWWVPDAGPFAAAGAAFLALVGAIAAFSRKRRFYLDRFADEGVVDSVPASS